MSEAAEQTKWQQTACILCSLNCGLEVQLGGESGRELVRVKGDKAHPASQGYTCEKPQRLNFYQNSPDRLTSPLRRKDDGTFEQIDWDTAISEIAEKFNAIKANHGGESIVYYGGGGQGNHLGGTYGDSTLKALGVKYRSNALAQEKTGEFWVQGKMLGTGVHADFEHCEVAVFVGKNPWQSHGFARARAVLREIAKDPARSMVVIDPRRSETADLADFHLQIKPGTDAWCLSALVAIIVQDNLIAREWLAEHAAGLEPVEQTFSRIPISEYAERCGVPEELLRAAAHRIARASSVAMMEDLGMQMSVHSTLGSYLQRLVWLLTGNFAREGTNNALIPLVAVEAASKGNSLGKGDKVEKLSPVVGAKIITGLVPCNVIPEEILTDHPKRYRAMLVESGNPAHSMADSQRWRDALDALDLVVVIDVAMTETARLAHYVLPAPSQYEKYEATYFNIEFPNNYFHLRRPLFDAMPGTLPEPEIHARLTEALGVLKQEDIEPLKAAAHKGRMEFAQMFFTAAMTNPTIAKLAPVVLYRTLGPTLPDGAAAAAVLWGACHLFVQGNKESAAAAGFVGDPFTAGEKLFEAVLNNGSGFVFSSSDYEHSWKRIKLPDHKVNLAIPEMLAEMEKLTEPLKSLVDFPFILSAGERRTDTSNTIIRNPDGYKKERQLSLRMSPPDAEALDLNDGEHAILTTRRGSATVSIQISDMMQAGHISIPNGLGLDFTGEDGSVRRIGVAPNELTSLEDRDFLAHTPWHKYIPARVEKVGEAN